MTLVYAEVARDVVAVHGPDAATFLQGQVSQEVEALSVGASAWSFILQPTGKVDGFARIQRDAPDRFTLDTDAGAGAGLMARLQRFKLRTKAEIEMLEGWRSVAVRGPGAAAIEGVLVGWWAASDAGDLVGPDVVAPPDASLIDASAFERLRIEAGWPAVGAELTPDTIPAESGVVAVAASFTKGCYTGQELVARIDSRGGNVPRHLRRLRATTGAIPVGARLADGHKDVGWVTSSAGDVALGYVGRAIEPGATVTAEGVAVTVEAITPLL